MEQYSNKKCANGGLFWIMLTPLRQGKECIYFVRKRKRCHSFQLVAQVTICFFLWSELRVFAKGLNFDMVVEGFGDSDTFGDIILCRLLWPIHSFDQNLIRPLDALVRSCCWHKSGNFDVGFFDC